MGQAQNRRSKAKKIRNQNLIMVRKTKETRQKRRRSEAALKHTAHGELSAVEAATQLPHGLLQEAGQLVQAELFNSVTRIRLGHDGHDKGWVGGRIRREAASG